jgi:transcription elongation GreA/GreB family factor
MSRAFVKETDEVAELPDRPVSAYVNLVTPRGLTLIEDALARWRDALAAAQAAGDRGAIGSASRELRYWSARRASALVQDPLRDRDVVRFGSKVTIERDDGRQQTFRIVGEDEGDPAAGLLSHASPLARALIGRRLGDVVTLDRGEAEILAIGVAGD